MSGLRQSVSSNGENSDAVAATISAEVQLATLASKNEVPMSGIAHLTAKPSFGSTFCNHRELLPSVMIAFVIVSELFLNLVNATLTQGW
jgi:hypothetical protein